MIEAAGRLCLLAQIGDQRLRTLELFPDVFELRQEQATAILRSGKAGKFAIYAVAVGALRYARGLQDQLDSKASAPISVEQDTGGWVHE